MIEKIQDTKYKIRGRGFTLIELLVVMTIIGILATLSLVALDGARRSGRDGKRKADLEEVRSALEIYRADCKSYPVATWTTNWPSTLTGDDSSSSCSSANVYLRPPQDPQDPVRYYRYSSSDGVSHLLCAGLEGQGRPGACDTQSCGDTASCNYTLESP